MRKNAARQLHLKRRIQAACLRSDFLESLPICWERFLRRSLSVARFCFFSPVFKCLRNILFAGNFIVLTLL